MSIPIITQSIQYLQNKMKIFNLCVLFIKNRGIFFSTLIVYNFTNVFVNFFFQGFNMDAAFTLSRRGQLKLVHHQYEFTRVRCSRNTLITTWRCSLPHSFPQFKCDVKAFTKKFGNREMVKVLGVHSHAPGKQEELRLRKKTTTSLPPFAIIWNFVYIVVTVFCLLLVLR